MKKIVLFLATIFILVVAMSCKDSISNGVTAPQTLPEFIEISEPLNRGNYFMGSWVGDKIIMTTSLRQIDIDMRDSFVIKSDIRLPGLYPDYEATGSTFVRLNTEGTKLLFIGTKSNYVSVGALWEYDLATKKYTKFLDSTHNVSSAAYAPNNDSLILFYSYGLRQDYGTKAGYYYYNRYTKNICLIVSHFPFWNLGTADDGLKEQINGFDVSPDGAKLLIPIPVRMPELQPPKIIEYDIASNKADTLQVGSFERYTNRDFLWLRYSPNGKEILYCYYPPNCLASGAVRDGSEIGIIDRATYTREVLSKPLLGADRPVLAVWPMWSSDGHHICFGVTSVANNGKAGSFYTLYIKTNVR